MDNLERNLIETAERAKSNTHRIDELEQTQKTIQELDVYKRQVIAIIYAVVGAINQFTGTSLSATGIIAGAFAVLGAFLLNTFVIPVWNYFAAFANFLMNLFNDPVAAIKILFYDLMLNVLGFIRNIMHGVEDMVNMIPFVNVDLTSGIDSLYDSVQSAKEQTKQNSEWKEYLTPMGYVDYSNAATSGYNWGARCV